MTGPSLAKVVSKVVTASLRLTTLYNPFCMAPTVDCDKSWGQFKHIKNKLTDWMSLEVFCDTFRHATCAKIWKVGNPQK